MWIFRFSPDLFWYARPVSYPPRASSAFLATMLAPSHRASREEPEAPRAPVATRRTEAAAECDARASPPPSLLPPCAPPLSPPPSPPTPSAPSAVAAASSRPATGARGAIGPERAAGGGRFSLRDDGLRMPPPSPHMHAAGRPRLDLSTPLEACGAIRVALLPVGAIDAASFRRYARLCAAHASQLELAEITHGQARVSVRVGLRDCT